MIVINLRRTGIIALHKLRKLTEHCSEACPGWAVFESIGGIEIQACDDCWAGKPNRLTDDEAAAIPEARRLLAQEMRESGAPLTEWQLSLGYPIPI